MKKEEFSLHVVHETLKAVHQELRFIVEAQQAIDLDVDEQFDQIAYLSWCVNQSNPSLILVRTLDSIEARLQDLLSFLKSSPVRAAATPEAAEVLQFKTDISNYLSQAIEFIQYPRFQQVLSQEAGEAIAEVRAGARNAISSTRQMAAAHQENLRKEISSLKSLLDREQAALKKQADLVAKLQQNIADQQAAVSLDAASKAAAFDGLIEQRQLQLDSWSSVVNERGLDYLRKIENYYKLTANVTLSGRFEVAAREEQVSYRINLGLAVAFFILAIASVMIETWVFRWNFYRLLSDPLFIWLGKVSLVAVCLVPASIFATQATKHRRASIWYKTVGVRIATLKPYLSEFEGDYTAELKEIIKSFFVSRAATG